MPYCPTCGNKYATGDSKCSDCGILVPEYLPAGTFDRVDLDNPSITGTSRALHKMALGFRTLKSNPLLLVLPILFSILSSGGDWLATSLMPATFRGGAFPVANGSFFISGVNAAYILQNPTAILPILFQSIGSLFSAVPAVPTGIFRLAMGNAWPFGFIELLEFGLLSISVAMNCIQWRWTEGAVSNSNEKGFSRFGLIGICAILLSIIWHPLVNYALVQSGAVFQQGPSSIGLIFEALNFGSAFISLPLFALAMASLVASRFRIKPLHLFIKTAFCVEAVYLLTLCSVIRIVVQLVNSYFISYGFTLQTQHADLNLLMVQTLVHLSLALCGAYVVAIWFQHLHQVARRVEEFEPLARENSGAE